MKYLGKKINDLDIATQSDASGGGGSTNPYYDLATKYNTAQYVAPTLYEPIQDNISPMTSISSPSPSYFLLNTNIPSFRTGMIILLKTSRNNK